jgi:hypothetical protein
LCRESTLTFSGAIHADATLKLCFTTLCVGAYALEKRLWFRWVCVVVVFSSLIRLSWTCIANAKDSKETKQEAKVTSSFKTKAGLAQMLKGGVIMGKSA